MTNRIAEKFLSHSGFSAEDLARAIEEISQQTGFTVQEEIHRRFIYDPSKTWRVSFKGKFEGKPTLLRVENMSLEVDEEKIRQAFRYQATGWRVRPPHTYRFNPFSPEKGYAWSIEEFVDSPMLFEPGGDSDIAAHWFSKFYRELRAAVSKPFWNGEEKDVESFSQKQFETWRELAEQREPGRLEHFRDITDALADRVLHGMRKRELVFCHPHLAGSDVRVNEKNEWIVYANFFWSWRQPGYDIAFPIWGQWLARSDAERTPESIRKVTMAWLTEVERSLSDLVDPEDVKTMLFNRLYGSLLLDIPAQRVHRTEESVSRLEEALTVEAARLLGT